jgi:hypothetical protein
MHELGMNFSRADKDRYEHHSGMAETASGANTVRVIGTAVVRHQPAQTAGRGTSAAQVQVDAVVHDIDRDDDGMGR